METLNTVNRLDQSGCSELRVNLKWNGNETL